MEKLELSRFQSLDVCSDSDEDLVVADVEHISNDSRQRSSKYDYVKVRVWLQDHFYVLSRYLVCRALVSTMIEQKNAVRISLDLKKTLVDLGLVDITQENFEEYLYKTMLAYGHGQLHVSRYCMMSSFHRNRIPLVILLAGTGCIGKSTLATKLAERLNLSSVLQTDMVYNLMKSIENLSYESFSEIHFENDDLLVDQYHEHCKLVHEGVNSDISKCFKEGKSIIVEGFHVDPLLYRPLVCELEAGKIGSESSATNNEHGYGIVIPFVLTLNEEDHIDFFNCSTDSRYQNKDISNFRAVENYLVSSIEKENTGFTEVPHNIHSFTETLEFLHDAVLKRIEDEYKQKKW